MPIIDEQQVETTEEQGILGGLFTEDENEESTAEVTTIIAEEQIETAEE